MIYTLHMNLSRDILFSFKNWHSNCPDTKQPDLACIITSRWYNQNVAAVCVCMCVLPVSFCEFCIVHNVNVINWINLDVDRLETETSSFDARWWHSQWVCVLFIGQDNQPIECLNWINIQVGINHCFGELTIHIHVILVFIAIFPWCKTFMRIYFLVGFFLAQHQHTKTGRWKNDLRLILKIEREKNRLYNGKLSELNINRQKPFCLFQSV